MKRLRNDASRHPQWQRQTQSLKRSLTWEEIKRHLQGTSLDKTGGIKEDEKQTQTITKNFESESLYFCFYF
jgi:hypothetical protein